MSGILYYPAYQVKIDDDAVANDVLKHLCAIRAERIFASTKIPTTRLDYSNYLLRNGFCLVNTNVTFYR